MSKKALIVDDVSINCELLSDMLCDEYEIITAENGEEALDILTENQYNIAILLLDLMMPVMTGYDVLQELKAMGMLNRFPIMIISSETDAGCEERCLSYGISDFIKKPFNPQVVLHRVHNSIALFSYKNELESLVYNQTKELKAKNQKLEEVNENTIDLLANIVEARNLESGSHVKRVKSFTHILADVVATEFPEYGLNQRNIKTISQASAMHDIGKIMVSDAILLKPGKLTPEEFEIMKLHTVNGCKILDDAGYLWEGDYYEYTYQICRHHHEKWDGRGYPDGLKGDEIPIAAQIVAVADCYDALTTERPYKKPFSPEQAYSMIMNGECGEFNPKIKKAFEICKDSFATLAKQSQ